MSIYEKNLKAKEKGSALFAEPNENNKYTTLNYSIIIENIKSKAGLLTSKIKLEETDPGVLVHSLYNPVQEAKRKIEALDLNKNTMIVVFGIGLGYHLLELKNSISSNSRVVVIENSIDVFNNIMQNVDITEILEDRRFSFLIGLHPEQILYYFSDILKSTLTFFLASTIQFMTMSYYEKVFPAFPRDMSRDIIKMILNSWHCLGNSPADTLQGLVQNFKNIDVAIENPGIDQIKGRYKNKPAIIVSAGPSLDKNVDLLKEVEGKALIIATDATLRGLTKRGIKPDAVVSLERVFVYEQLLKDRDYEIPKEVVWAGPPLIQSEVFEEFKSNKKLICYKAGEPVNTWIDKNIGGKGTVVMGNNVAHTALGIALKLGANPIAFIGQDLAFSKEGETHGTDISKEVKVMTKVYTMPEDIVYLEDYEGAPIKSTVTWKTFLIGFEKTFMDNKDIVFIDATEGGAYIKGTKIMTLRDVIDKYIKNESIKRLYELIPENDLLTDKKKIYNTLYEAFDEKLKHFESILNLSKECLNDLKKLKRKYKKRNNDLNRVENQEVCRQLLKANEVHKMMMREELSMLFFQGLFASVVYEVNELGLELVNENVWKNLLLQEDFLMATVNIADTTTRTLQMIKEFIKAKIDNYPNPVNPDEYIKFSVRYVTD